MQIAFENTPQNLTSEILAVRMPLAIYLSAFDYDNGFQYLLANPNLIVSIYQLEFTLQINTK